MESIHKKTDLPVGFFCHRSFLLRSEFPFFLAGIGLGLDDFEGLFVGELLGFFTLGDLVVVFTKLDVRSPDGRRRLGLYWVGFAIPS